jgi:hypothetical protein
MVKGVAAAYLMFPGMYFALIAPVVFSGHPHEGLSEMAVTLIAILVNFPCYLAVSYASLSFLRKQSQQSHLDGPLE